MPALIKVGCRGELNRAILVHRWAKFGVIDTGTTKFRLPGITKHSGDKYAKTTQWSGEHI